MEYNLVDAAIRFAAERHSGAFLDGPDPLPYICHPLDVLHLARTIGEIRDEPRLVAAVLHDLIEETTTTEVELIERFGPEPARIVSALTREEPTPVQTANMSKDQVWSLRSQMLLDEIAAMPPDVWPIKLADRLSNVREAKQTKKGAKRERYLGQTRAILKIIPLDINPALWEAIRREVD